MIAIEGKLVKAAVFTRILVRCGLKIQRGQKGRIILLGQPVDGEYEHQESWDSNDSNV